VSQIEVVRAHRDAAIGGAAIAVVVTGAALVASAVLFALGVLAIVLGAVLCVTVIGAIVGLPLILLGIIALVGAAVGWAGGVPFALILGAGVGFLWYRRRVRGLPTY